MGIITDISRVVPSSAADVNGVPLFTGGQIIQNLTVASALQDVTFSVGLKRGTVTFSLVKKQTLRGNSSLRLRLPPFRLEANDQLLAFSDGPAIWTALGAELKIARSTTLRIYATQGTNYTAIIGPGTGSPPIRVAGIVGCVQGSSDAIATLAVWDGGIVREIIPPTVVPGYGSVRAVNLPTVSPGFSIRARSDARMVWFSYGENIS